MLLPPLLGFECDGDVNGGVGERAGQKSLRGLESVHQGVAVGEEKSRGPRSVALLVDEGQQRRFQSRAGRLEVSEGALDEVVGTLGVLGEQRDHLDVGEKGDSVR